LPFIGKGRVADVGSGAGLPGIPLALSLPETRFVLIDSNGKKTRFLNQAKMVLNLDNVDVIHQRVEDYSPKDANIGIYFDTIIARAYANTQDILKSTAHLQKQGTRILVMQGKLDEVIKMPGYELKHSHLLDVHGLDADRHLLEIIKI
jgi:16S rRNA (guanine527-N7)-methyltransferase